MLLQHVLITKDKYTLTEYKKGQMTAPFYFYYIISYHYNPS